MAILPSGLYDILDVSTHIDSPCRAHKEILYFASPFFEAALSGHWSETGRPHSMSSIITISQPPSIPGDRSGAEAEMTFSATDPDSDSADLDALFDIDTVGLTGNDGSDVEGGSHYGSHSRSHSRSLARDHSLAKLQGSSLTHRKSVSEGSTTSVRKVSTAHAKVKRHPKDGPDAVIVLKEERVSVCIAAAIPNISNRCLGRHFS